MEEKMRMAFEVLENKAREEELSKLKDNILELVKSNKYGFTRELVSELAKYQK